MFSLNCSHPSLFLRSIEIHVHKPKVSKVSLFWADFSVGSLRFRQSRKWVFRRAISHPKSVKTEGETDQSTQPSGEEASVSRDGGSPSSSFLSILCPLLKLFGGGDPSRERSEVLEIATSSLSSLARLPWGTKSLRGSSQPREYKDSPPVHLQLYEFEACPFCRRVREAMTELDLTVEVYPCPKGSVRHREMVQQLGGKEQFPFLVDPNIGVSLYESGDIVKYLFQQYGQGRNPSLGLLERKSKSILSVPWRELLDVCFLA